MAAFINSAALIAITFFLFYQTARRLAQPETVYGEVMMLVAAVGILANLA